jgi:two-component system sensor histidine kinase PilS (NtrC family)
MNFLTRAFSPDEEGKLRKLPLIRLVFATLVVGAAIMVLQFDGDPISIVALYGLLGMLYISTGIVYIGYRAGLSLRPLLWGQILTDIAVLTLIVHYSGGSNSYFTIIYVLPILVAGVYFQLQGGLTAALVATSAYIVYTSLEVHGSLSVTGSEWIVSPHNIYRPLLKSYLHVIVFILAGFMSGYVSSHFLSKGEELADREQELRSVRLSTDSVIKNMSSGLIVTDMKGIMLTVNPAALDILRIENREGIEGKPIGGFKSDLKALTDELELAIERGTPRKRCEIEITRGDGSIVPLGLSVSILRDTDHAEKGVIALFQNLTEVHRMREKVRQADKMAAIGRLSASIAHEIRAPLASICGSIEMLKGELELSDENVELMDLITKESDRLDNIITDFLEFARMKKPAFTSVDVEKCLREVVMLLRHSSMMKRKVSMEVDCRVEGVKILADDELLRQVFLNIMINACEAMRSAGRLSITVDRITAQLDEDGDAEDCVRIDFENNGPSIPREVLNRLFEPFFTTKEGGTGLGLAIAARIVEGHGGQIKVESSDGSPTIFSILMPVAANGKVEDGEDNEEIVRMFACY